MLRHFALAFSCALLAGSLSAQESTVSAAQRAQTRELTGLEVHSDPTNPDRFRLVGEYLLENVPGQIDQAVDVPSSCSQRSSWRGTRLRGGGQKLLLNSTLRYEKWACLIVKTRLVRKSFDIDWSLSVKSPVSLNNLALAVNVQDIHGIADEIEDWFDLREKLSKTVRIPLPAECGRCDCVELADDLVPVAEEFRFAVVDQVDVLVTSVFSMEKDLSPALRCFE